VNLLAGTKTFLATALGALWFWAIPTNAQQKTAPVASEQVVITSTKPATDEELTKRVETVLDSDRYLDASHMTVTTKDGVVTLGGLVGDSGDLLRALRISSRIPGARRVIDDLETYEPDGFGN
jgi:osmotically-inducible protein OsmY